MQACTSRMRRVNHLFAITLYQSFTLQVENNRGWYNATDERGEGAVVSAVASQDRPSGSWSYDLLTDRTEDRRQLRLLVVIDEYTRECVAIEVGRPFTALDVIGVLQ